MLLTAIAFGPAAALSADEDVERALAAVRRQAMAGDAVAQYSLGSFLYYGGTDVAQAIEWIRRAAEQKYAPAEFHVGLIYDFGFGVAADEREALAWYRKAADQGNPAAQRQVAEFFRRGRGVEVDPAEAVRWYQRAAERDDLRAQYQLGQMYFDGTGVARDYASAYVWFSVAASQTPLVDNYKALIELRNIAAARMSPDEEAFAARRAAQWKPTVSP